MEYTRYYTTLTEALSELHRRRNDRELMARVEEYLNGDIPDLFRTGPVLYLARHVATPNRETLAFLEVAKHLNIRYALGQDPHDLFVSHNSLKHALGKMPIIRGYSKTGCEIVEHVTIINFNKWQGCRLRDVFTMAGTNLISFHNSLFSKIGIDTSFLIHNDATWIDRNARGNLMEHYKKHLALFIVHGILFEYFPSMDTAEQRMVAEVLAPAYDHIRTHLGVGPLVTPPVTPTQETSCNWEAYSEVVMKHALAERELKKEQICI
jgi:hypothetical protein